MLDDEDSNNITVGSLVTVLVKLTRQTMAVSSYCVTHLSTLTYVCLLLRRLICVRTHMYVHMGAHSQYLILQRV